MDSALKINMKDKTAYRVGTTYFMRSRFADDCILAFYFDKPCGNRNDMDTGWVVIDPNKNEIVNECATKICGSATGEYRRWIIGIRADHGKTVEVFRNGCGEMLWKMNE